MGPERGPVLGPQQTFYRHRLALLDHSNCTVY
jgi:hypothetical protein